MPEDIRWKQRFDNYCRAFSQLNKAVEVHFSQSDNELIQMALVKAFEMTFELAWKTMKDYLRFNGIDVKLPREVIKQAFANDIIVDGQLWIYMLENRNVMAHVYDEARAQATVQLICQQYMPALIQLHQFLQEKSA
ncbi:MAG TPA: nucleotidyltransferase [Desulfuromonadales bacterium]|nr:nucleotidyltransferase [Desulfuromonadales bacterium]